MTPRASTSKAGRVSLGAALPAAPAAAPAGAGAAWQRRHSRLPVELPVAVTASGSAGAPHAAVVHRTGERWAWLRSPVPFEPGSTLRLRFQMPAFLSFYYQGLLCDFPAEVARCVPSKGDFELLLRWPGGQSALVRRTIARHWVRTGVVLAPLIAAMIWLRFITAQYFWYDPWVYFYSLGVGTYFISRFFLCALHRPPQPSNHEPSLSIVMSVRNEEEVVASAVESCYEAEYPDHKREVIVIDDGSNDGTPRVLQGLRKRHPELQVFTLPPSGKRHGMAKGVREAKHELVVFVDSDTILDRAALRHIVSGFDNPRQGASSGYCSALNSETNLLTMMTDVRYLLSFELMKRAEALFGMVTCCPGVLSAYRRKALLKILDKWLHQTFLGAPSTFGDDRSLTNFILRDYDVQYNPNALCTTVVPDTWGKYLKQQLRWKKSWARETLIAATFMWKKNPIGVLGFYMGAVVSVMSPLMVARAIYLEVTDPEFMIMHYVLGLVIMAMSMGLFCWMRKPNLRWITGTAFVATQLFIHGPQTYWALLTIRKSHWGTR